MSIYLVQHGKAHSKDVDPGRGLTEEGAGDVRRIADVARGYGVHISVIKHSGKKRALQTAEIFASVVGAEQGIKEIGGINPNDDVKAFAEGPEIEEDAMIVGHLPFMERLAAYLITGNDEKPVFKFQNGGILCLGKLDDTEGWIIKWALMPEIG